MSTLRENRAPSLIALPIFPTAVTVAICAATGGKTRVKKMLLSQLIRSRNLWATFDAAEVSEFVRPRAVNVEKRVALLTADSPRGSRATVSRYVNFTTVCFSNRFCSGEVNKRRRTGIVARRQAQVQRVSRERSFVARLIYRRRPTFTARSRGDVSLGRAFHRDAKSRPRTRKR